jgi:hypothetical protein
MKSKKKQTIRQNDEELREKKKKIMPKQKYRHFTNWLEEDKDDTDSSFDFFKWADA